MLLRTFTALLILTLSAQIIAYAQSPIERRLTTALRGKVVSLRTFSKSSHLHFDSDGNPKKPGETGSWTIYSQFLVTNIEVSGSSARLSGNRIVHHYDRNQSKLIASRSDMSVDVEIDLKKNATADEIAMTIVKAFVGAEGLTPYVPDYWRPYLRGEKSGKTACGSSDKSVRVGGAIQAANLIKQVRPVYSPEARNFLLQGLVALEVEITEKGDIGSLIIATPAGAGFDESAVEAVSQWKYKPTLVDGSPVCTVTTVTVNYEFSR